MDANEAAWLGRVEERLGTRGASGASIDDETKRLLLRVTKVTADVTGVRYLAPLTAYLVGFAAGRAEATGERLDLRSVAEAISELAAGWSASA